MSAIPGFLTAAEAADVIGVSHSQLARYVREKRLPARRVGQVILVRREDAESFVRPTLGDPDFGRTMAKRRRKAEQN